MQHRQRSRAAAQLLVKRAVSDAFVGDVLGTGGTVALGTGAAAGLAAGLYTSGLLESARLEQAARAFSQKARIPIATAVGIIAGIAAMKTVGIPLGVAAGASAARREPVYLQAPGGGIVLRQR